MKVQSKGFPVQDQKIKRYKQYGQWYKTAATIIKKRFGSDYALVCDLLAATSPRKQVKANWKLAVRIYHAHKDGKPNPAQGLMPCHKANVDRALKQSPLSGNKVKAFAENLKGNAEAVTIDVWVLRYYNIKKETLSDKDYKELSDRIRAEAKEQNLAPAEYQAIIWTISRAKYGYKPSSFVSAIGANQLTFAFMDS